MTNTPKSNNFVGCLVAIAIVAIIASIVIPNMTSKSSPNKTDTEDQAKLPPIPAYTIELPAEGAAPASGPRGDAVDLFFCLDVSGSMDAKIDQVRKIDISKKTMVQVFGQIDRFQKQHPERKIKVGLCSFNSQAHVILPLQPFDMGKFVQAIGPLRPDGGTAIGGALCTALTELVRANDDAKAILVMTDGANTAGVVPEMVMQAIKQSNNSLKASTSDVEVFLVAFDVTASHFADVKRAGAEVVESRDSKSLEAIMGSLVEQVLLEAQ
jgi:hypothetical protein